MNKLYLYAPVGTVDSVDFLLFDKNAVLVETLEGILDNINNVWYTTISVSIPEDEYIVIAKYGERVLGSETIYWDGVNIIPKKETIAKAVRDELTTELSHLMTLQNSNLTTEQATMLLEIYRLLGLDPTKPLIVSKTSRTAGSEINQAIADTGTQTVVTRIP